MAGPESVLIKRFHRSEQKNTELSQLWNNQSQFFIQKKFFFQLGGKNAGIVFSDVDLDKCLPTMIRSSFANQGEICLTTSRIFVQEAIFKEFVERFVELTK